MAELEVDTIEEFLPLHDPNHAKYNARYQVYYGGRGGRKSWETARGIILRAFRDPLLILCTREIQNSIDDSVLRLLSNQIENLGLSYFFEIKKTSIKAQNGSEFIFKGLNRMTIDSLKSLEGVDICWVEEAHSVSDHSWNILIPTIRKQDSQIFITFNPDLEDDPVNKRFIENPPPNSYIQKISYLNNPDCPDTLIEEAEYLRKVDYDSYAHIWLGEFRTHSEAQIFKGKYKIESFKVDESLNNPLDGVDWGFANDPTVKIRSYIANNILYIRYETYKVGCEIDDTPALFDKIPDSRDYLARADNARPELISHMKRKGYRIEPADKWEGCVEDRVDFIKNFEKVIIHPECIHTAEEFRLYKYKTDKRTGDVLPQIEDKNNHCIDAIGYALTPLIRQKQNLYEPV